MSIKFKETLNKSNHDNEANDEVKEDSKIVTTLDELNAFAILKSILRRAIDSKQITYRDTESNFGISIDNNGQK